MRLEKQLFLIKVIKVNTMKKMKVVGLILLLGWGTTSIALAQQKLSRVELEERVAQLEDEVETLRGHDKTLRKEELEEQLGELKAVDKNSLTKVEKKAWRKEKREISQELAELDGRIDPRLDPWRFGYPYSRFGGLYGWGWGNPYRFRAFRYRRPVFVVVRPRVKSS